VVLTLYCASHPRSGVNNKSYQITRTRKPNTLTLDSKVVEQVVVNDLLRLNEETLKRTIFVGQFVPLFLDLKPEQQSSLFSEALDLDKWLTASEQASQHNKECEDKIKRLEVNRATLQGRLEQLIDQFENELGREKTFELEKKKAYSTLLNELAMAQDKLDRAQHALNEAQEAQTHAGRPGSRQD
jgi:DNA repair exonuclease SbcCD ATPase subunit